ncbi:diguanylate cyclase domain-containing protein [Azohydromonas sediminis]|uniref:diguanylate cyclase domain-containing protein n=1 Tax=Azohydromonas sediminis TaxID=2259674 RepID=UPI0013C31A37|nr:diguanylate cyclase [Azohydromonas sediminis]
MSIPARSNPPPAIAGAAGDDVCPDAVVAFDAALQLVHANRAAAALAGQPPAALAGLDAARLMSLGLLAEPVGTRLAEVRSSATAQRVQARDAFGGGAGRWYDVWIVPRADGGVTCYARDISDMKDAEERLRASAGRDSLTGLLNHAAFHDAVSRALATSGPDAPDVALVLFDLDYLKLINDVHGHQTGDEALRRVAEALRATTRDVDVVARLGGDEFAALFVGLDRERVQRIAQRAVARIGATMLPGVGRLSVSAGIAFVASTREPGDLFDRADAAVYDAKARGRGVASVADMTEIACASRRRDVTEDLPPPPPPDLPNARDVVTAARGALREWVHVLACSGGCVDLLDTRTQAVKAVAYYRFGHDDWKLAEQTYALADYPDTARALALGQTYSCRVDDPEVDPAEAALLRQRGFASMLLTPLVSAGRPIGIIELFDTRARVFTSTDQRVAMALAHHLAPLLALLQERDGASA